MSLPYFPMYPSDFEAKTSHLTLAEDGAYNRLLRIMWMTSGCTIPDDDAWIMRRLRCDKDTFDTIVRVVIDEFFTSKNGRLSNAKLSVIFDTTNEAHEKRVAAGSKGGKAKALQTKDKASSNATAKPKQPEPEPEPLKRDTKVSPKKPSAKELVYNILSQVAGDDAVNGFIEMRWNINARMTERSAKLIADKLRGKMNADAILDLSTENNWKTVYPNSKQLNGGHNGNGTYNRTSKGGERVDPALEQIARLSGISAAPGNGGR